MKFVDVIKDIQKKLVKIIGTKDVDKRKSMIVNLAAAISVLQTDYPLSKNQKEILNQILRILAKEYEILDEPDIDFSDIEDELDIDFSDIESELEVESEVVNNVPLLHLDGLTEAEARILFEGIDIVVTDDRNASRISEGKILKVTKKLTYFDFEISNYLDDGSVEKFNQTMDVVGLEKFITRQSWLGFNITTDFTDWSSRLASNLRPIRPIKTTIPFAAQVNARVVEKDGEVVNLSLFFKDITKYEYPDNIFFKLTNKNSYPEDIIFVESANMDIAVNNNPVMSVDLDFSVDEIRQNIFYRFYRTQKQQMKQNLMQGAFRINALRLILDSNIPQQTKLTKNVKGAGRKFDTSWVKKFLTEAPMDFIEGDLEKFIKGDEDEFILQFYNDKGIRITYKGNNFYKDYLKETESKYNSKTKTRTKKFKNKKEFLAALKRLIK